MLTKHNLLGKDIYFSWKCYRTIAINEFKQSVITKAISPQAHGSGEAIGKGRVSEEPQSQEAEQNRFLRTTLRL